MILLETCYCRAPLPARRASKWPAYPLAGASGLQGRIGIKPAMLTITNYVNGRFVGPAGSQFFPKIDPAIGAAIAQVPDSDERDVALAVEAAANAFPSWSRTPVAERSRLLMTIAQRIEDRLGALAEAECRDTGKPLR